MNSTNKQYSGNVGRVFGLLTAIALGVGIARTSSALPPPLSHDELAKRSKLVVQADVLGVACTGNQENGLPTYTAWLQVIETNKGDARPFSTLQLVWASADRKLLGSWEAKVYPGDRVRLYLVPAEHSGAW